MKPEAQHWPQTHRVWQRFTLMDLVMLRMGVDFKLASRRANGQAMAFARDNCLGCSFDRDCRHWLESGGEGAALAEFCPNFGFFRACSAGFD